MVLVNDFINLMFVDVEYSQKRHFYPHWGLYGIGKTEEDMITGKKSRQVR